MGATYRTNEAEIGTCSRILGKINKSVCGIIQICGYSPLWAHLTRPIVYAMAYKMSTGCEKHAIMQCGGGGLRGRRFEKLTRIL